MGCPFGCRGIICRERSIVRSSTYYRTPEGRIKKQIQNERRLLGKPKRASQRHDVPSKEVMAHLRMVLGFIEGREVSKNEILIGVRQRSIDTLGKETIEGDTT